MKIDDLYFGIMRWDVETDSLATYNLFDSLRVKGSVALYAKKTEAQRKEISDPVAFCFGDTWGRYEWEMTVGGVSYNKPRKQDVYTMYVLPNKEHLMRLVSKVSANSAIKYLRSKETK